MECWARPKGSKTSTIQLKLDELIRALGAARTELVQMEALTDADLESLQKEFQSHRDRAAANLERIASSRARPRQVIRHRPATSRTPAKSRLVPSRCARRSRPASICFHPYSCSHQEFTRDAGADRRGRLSYEGLPARRGLFRTARAWRTNPPKGDSAFRCSAVIESAEEAALQR